MLRALGHQPGVVALQMVLEETSKLLELIPETSPGVGHQSLKPMQVRDYENKWSSTLKTHLIFTGKDYATLYVLVKHDGLSVTVHCNERGTLTVKSRTEKGKVLLQLFDAEHRTLTQVASELQVTFLCELTALYKGQEMGFLEVNSMLKKFKENSFQNTDVFQLKLSIFSVYSVNPEGWDQTERLCMFLSSQTKEKIIKACLVPGNPLMDVIQPIKYKARLYDSRKNKDGYELEFLRDTGSDRMQTVARTPGEFFQHLIQEADKLQIEGWVVTAPHEMVQSKPIWFPGKGVPRYRASVKVKREFNVTLAVVPVRNKTKKRTEYWTYGTNEQKRLVYAGDMSDHEVIRKTMAIRKTWVLEYENHKEKNTLYNLSPSQFSSRTGDIMMVQSDCTNLSKTRYCVIGLKNVGMKFPALALDKLSNLRLVAEQNPHFNSTKQASDSFAVAIGRGARKTPPNPRKRVQRSLGGSPPPPRRARAKIQYLTASQGLEEDEAGCGAPASLSYDDFAFEIEEDPPQNAQSPKMSRETSPVPVPRSMLPELVVPVPEVSEQEKEDAAFDEYLASTQAVLVPRRTQEFFWVDDNGERRPIMTRRDTVEVELSDGVKVTYTADSPEWTTPVPIDMHLEGKWRIAWLGPPPKVEPLSTIPRYRTPVQPVNVFIDSQAELGTAKKQLLKQKIWFFGGTTVKLLGPHVHIVVTAPASDANPEDEAVPTDKTLTFREQFMEKQIKFLQEKTSPSTVITNVNRIQLRLRLHC